MTDFPSPGDRKSLSVTISEELVSAFADYSGDRNRLHLDDDFARELGFRSRVAHGMSYASYLSTLIGMHLPGEGALWASQTIRFAAPAFIGDRVELAGTVTRVDPHTRTIRLEVQAVNQDGDQLMAGESEIVLPRPANEAPSAARSHARRRERGATASKVALVAGASGDLGTTISRTLAEVGFDVALGGRGVATLERLVSPIEACGGRALPVRLDLTDEASVASAIEAATQELGPVALVVHCATSKLENTDMERVPADVLAQHMDVQAGGLLRLFQASLGGMRECGQGQLVYIGSTATHGAPPKGLSAYTAAKTAGKSLARSIGVEYAHLGIRANIVSPYFLETGLTAHVSEKARMLAAARTPSRRLGTLEEVAGMVAFLASTASNFVNGHDLVVDGGVTMA